MRTLPPTVSATLALASDVPVMTVDCSLELMKLSPATVAIVGAFGATVSTVMLRVPAAETLPAASVACADRVSGPCPMAVTSSAVRV